MPFSNAEESMWEKPPPLRSAKASDAEINARYDSRERKIVVEANREKLPNFVQALDRKNYMELRPFYQRRLRWDAVRQSRFIESFIINIPVPPLFLYESKYNTYEVIDGQQRINAIQTFYENGLILKGLEHWPELNGRRYATLPSNIRAGIDRRSISYFVVLTESAQTDEEALLLKQIVFERLNTGGVKLSKQEIRNSIYNGNFNTTLNKLTENKAFRDAWKLPPFEKDEDEKPSDDLLNHPMYKTMADVEAILRFFALRHHDKYQRGMQGFLDLYMIRSKEFGKEDRDFLTKLFTETIELAFTIYGELVFRPFLQRKQHWAPNPQKAFADAVMVGLSEHINRKQKLASIKKEIIEATKKLCEDNPPGTFTGSANSKKDVQTRIGLYGEMISSLLQRR